MGMYTQVCGVLNIASVHSQTTTTDVNFVFHDLIDKFDSLSKDKDYYWNVDQMANFIHVLPGGNGSTFIAIAVEGKVIGYGNCWEEFLKELLVALPTSEGRIEWLYESDDVDYLVWYVSKGIITKSREPIYREGYGNC